MQFNVDDEDKDILSKASAGLLFLHTTASERGTFATSLAEACAMLRKAFADSADRLLSTPFTDRPFPRGLGDSEFDELRSIATSMLDAAPLISPAAAMQSPGAKRKADALA